MRAVRSTVNDVRLRLNLALRMVLAGIFILLLPVAAFGKQTAKDVDNQEANLQIKGDLNGAMTDYNQAIKLNPNNARAYTNRGNAKRKEGDLDGAMADYTRAAKLGGD
jgi:Flp pilus assembly protein TadD